jgi:integrase
VAFLFFTGCRPSEALAFSYGGRKVRSGLKTQDAREFPINFQLQEIVAEIKMREHSPEDYVFVGPKKGDLINFDNFRRRAWKAILNELSIKVMLIYARKNRPDSFLGIARSECQISLVNSFW